jgi:hypothetical protein
MIIRLYFDEFLPAWDELLTRLANLNSVEALFKRRSGELKGAPSSTS